MVKTTVILIITTFMMMKTCNGKAGEPMVRPATQANRFYTGDAKELSEEVDSLPGAASWCNRLS